jgi:hypothetical protein
MEIKFLVRGLWEHCRLFLKSEGFVNICLQWLSL